MRNDVVNVIFATYATFFNGLISNDEKAPRIYRGARFILAILSRAKIGALSR